MEHVVTTKEDDDDNDEDNGVVLFMNDGYSTFDFYWWKIGDLLRITTANDFACVETVFHRLGNEKMGKLSRSIYHDYQVWGGYSPAARNNQPDFNSNFDAILFYAAHIKAHLPAPYLPVCYGNMFAATLSSIRKVDHVVWNNMRLSLKRGNGNDIEENYFAERMFAALLSKPLSPAIGNFKIRNKRRVTKCSGLYENYCGVEAFRDDVTDPMVGDPGQLMLPPLLPSLTDQGNVETISYEALWLGIAADLNNDADADANSNLDRNISLVIWHCDKPLTWLKKYITGYEGRMRDVTVYSKCGNPVEDIPADGMENVHVEKVPTVYGKQYAYVHWLANHHDSEEAGDIIVFIHDNPYTSSEWQWWTFDRVLATAQRNGFGCAESFEPVNRGKEGSRVASNSYYHDVEAWLEYFQDEYFDEELLGHKHTYKKLQEWLVDPAIQLEGEIRAKLPLIPVCYNDAFAVTRNRIGEHAALWKTLEGRLKETTGVEESHFLSRSWAVLFSKPLPQAGMDKIMLLKTSLVQTMSLFHFPPRNGVLTYKVDGRHDKRVETNGLKPLVRYSAIIDKPFVDVHPRAVRNKAIETEEDEYTSAASWYGDTIESDVENLGSISLVVSHCDQSLDWISGYMFRNDKVTISDITVYSTCGIPVYGAPDGAKIIIADGVDSLRLGGPSHVFAHWIATQDTGANAKNKDDVVFFLHDSPHRVRDFLYWTFADMLRIVSANGFACAETTFEVDVGRPREVPVSSSIYHENEQLASYAPGRHESFNPNFSSDYRDLYEWMSTMDMNVFAEHLYQPVCYGGMFAATKAQLFTKKTVGIVQKMEKRLRRGAELDIHNDADLEETYFVSRTWAALLQKPLGFNGVRAVHKRKRNISCIDSRCGVLTFRYNHIPYPHNLSPMMLPHNSVGVPYVNEKNVTALWIGDVTNGDPGSLGKFEIVISHCDKPLHWLKEYVRGHSIYSITIYSKCGNPVEGAPEDSKVIRLPNVGRCDHTYAYWMARMPPVSAEVGNDTRHDVVLFIKDNDHRSQLWDLWSIDDMFRIASSNGFACAESVLPAPGEVGFEGVSISIYHNRTRWGEFSNGGYAREEGRDSIHEFKSKYTNLEAWAKDLELPVPYPFVPVCYGGIFMTTKNQIAKKGKAVWERLEKSLSREDNIEEGHFAERSWAFLLSKPLYPDRRKLLYERNGLVRCIGYFKGRCGVLSIKPAKLPIMLKQQGS